MENKKNTNADIYLFTKIVLPTFVSAYLHDLDVKSAVYDKFVDRMPKDGSSQYKERREVLYNCLYFFTNTKNIAQIEALKGKMVSEGKEFSCNNLSMEILSKFQEMLLGYNKDCFAALKVLPSFIEAYSKGLDVKDVYEKFISELPDEDNSQNREKRQIIENCLNLFKSAKCKEEIDALKLKLAGTGRQVSSEELAEKITSTFPEVVLSTSKRNYAEIVLSSFSNAYINQSDIKTIYDNFRDRISADNSSQNLEKRKVLENCLTFFRDVKTKDLLSQQAFVEQHSENNDKKYPSSEELVEIILLNYPEVILGDNKRKYDMSDKYCEGMGITIKGFKPSNIDEVPSLIHDDFINGEIIICRLGKLIYGTQSVSNESIDKYSISLPLENGMKQEYEVFSYIDIDRLYENRDYRQAVLRELLSKNNLELSNSGGYIGVIDEPNTHYDTEINVGDQIDDGFGTYRYRISKVHHLIYEAEPLTATMMWSRLQKREDEGR